MENGSTALSSILINSADSDIMSKWDDLKEKYGSEFKV